MNFQRAAGKFRLHIRNFNFSTCWAFTRRFIHSEKLNHIHRSGLRKFDINSNCNSHFWSILYLQSVITLGFNSHLALADSSPNTHANVEEEGSISAEWRRVEDDSVISNEHTIKWRIFTDSARNYFMQGKVNEAEKLFVAAINEAKEGFGESDAHVASSCNNLAELHRVRKEYDKAEPLYLESIKILEESFSPEDIRVGAALHNLGLFYLIQKKMVEARQSFERALKIKGRVLGHNHLDYGDTIYRLGMVLYLEGKITDAESLIHDSIDIMEGAGEGESIACMRRLRYLAQIYSKSNRLQETEKTQRRILHIMELSKGWESMETVIAADSLSRTLQTMGKLLEAQELLERCLKARKSLLSGGSLQIATNLLQLAKLILMNSDRHREISDLEVAENYLNDSVRIAGQGLVKLRKQISKLVKDEASENTIKQGRAALVVLLQALGTLGQAEIMKKEAINSEDKSSGLANAEKEFLRCISAFQEFQNEECLSNTADVKKEYVSCLKQLSKLIDSDKALKQSRRAMAADLNKTITQLEAQLVEEDNHNPSAV